MKVLRSTMWKTPDEKMTMVVRASDMRVPLETLIEAPPLPGGLITHSLFEMQGAPSIQEATMEALHRFEARANRERNMAILYFWDAMALRTVSPGGLLTPTQPAPLLADEIEPVLVQLAAHPNYIGQTVQVFSEEGSASKRRRSTRGSSKSTGGACSVWPSVARKCWRCGKWWDG